MDKKTGLGILLVATLLIKIALAIPLVSSLTCEGFTEQKLEDCQYILASDLAEDEKTDLLTLLASESYEEEIVKAPISNVGLKIETDQRAYNVGETIEVHIFPKDIVVSVTYGDTTKFVKDKTSFTAKEEYNRITAKYKEENDDKVVTITGTQRLLLAWNIFVFFMFNYFTYSVLTKSSWVAKWLSAVS